MPDPMVVGETVFLPVVTSTPVDKLIDTAGTGYPCGYEMNCSEVPANETCCAGGVVEEPFDGPCTELALVEMPYGVATEIHVDYCTVMPVVTSGSCTFDTEATNAVIMCKIPFDPAGTRNGTSVRLVPFACWA